ncbi:Serine/threonine protein kinase [Actinopolymorpha cephalotaxi]|uniref:non-specific serine/threonine protein kinase n=1 Tax=Actinopolymorpha cephalotaxi TaxID=504797 RepID=A0A1I2QWX5_9ACTN|nr:protein kinase [Actinopolymorpha cephalotaxi]NYH82554.1 serine/threonine protein kinase [Actinopolymorpha cephalotaxi]SFG30186.1 Serine/threonine protein kinase [Actinopolymorpha cephalotaxi]
MGAQFRVQGYDLGALISASATGEVWEAHRHGTGDHVALRRIRPRTPDAREDVRRLAAVLAMIGHPHLVRVHEALPLGDEVVWVLDHADGGSLDQLLHGRGQLDPGEVVTTAAPVAEALAAAHERGLLHGDVTPEAILYTAEGRPLLTDVGVLALVEGGESLGTHGYTDPDGPPGPATTPAGDVYGLAAVCYTALTGVVPRPGQARPPLAEAVPDAPPGLLHAVGAGLQPVAARRPTAAQFADLLYAACPPAPVRFPVGLVLTDADLAAMTGASPAPEAPAATPEDGSPPASPTAERTSADPGEFTVPGVPGGPDGDLDLDLDDEDDERRSRIRVIAAAAAVVVLVAGAVVGGIAWAKRSDNAPDAGRTAAPSTSPTAPAAPETPAPSATSRPTAKPTPTLNRSATPRIPPGPAGAEARWRKVLATLDARRAQAYATNDPAVLAGVYYPAGSDLAADDRTEIDKCVRAGCHLEGLRFAVRTLHVDSERPDRAVLRVVDQLQAYSVVSDDGERVPRPAGEPKNRRITLVRTGQGWLISRIEER